MTSRADLFDLNQQRVAVAIERDVFHRLRVAAYLAFHPEFLARPTPEMRLARLDGFLQRSAIHPRHHQDAPGGLLLHDGGNQAVRSEFQFFVKAHWEIGGGRFSIFDLEAASGFSGRKVNATAAKMQTNAAM